MTGRMAEKAKRWMKFFMRPPGWPCVKSPVAECEIGGCQGSVDCLHVEAPAVCDTTANQLVHQRLTANVGSSMDVLSMHWFNVDVSLTWADLPDRHKALRLVLHKILEHGLRATTPTQ